MVSENVGWSHSISGSPKYFEVHCKNMWIFSVISEDLRWPHVMSSHVKWIIFGDQMMWADLTWCQVMSGSILKYQMIWGDLSWTEVILRDLWCEITSHHHSWSQVISNNIGWSQVISRYPKCCELNYEDLRLFSLISEDLRWSQVSWGDLKSRQAI